jgi:hypothetical protein
MPRRVSLPTVVGDNIPELFPPGDHRKTIDLKQLAELTGMAGPTLRDWIRRGLISGAFQSKKHAKWRFRREMVAKWWRETLMQNNIPPKYAHDLASRVETYVPPPPSDVLAAAAMDASRKGYQEGYRDGYRDGMANKPAANLTTQNESEDFGPFIKPYPTPTEIAARAHAQ